jgi:tetratricopeptide (TPR) repeat protein
LTTNDRRSTRLRAATNAAERAAHADPGRYRIEGPLGAGGMASVWRVWDLAANRPLALKRLAKTASGKHVARFEREYYTLASLRHPSLVEVYDYGVDEEGPHYSMELLEGSDLSELAPMPWADACRVLRDVASALALLHARRLVHRDISARNVWRMPDGRIKLIDFGTLTAFGKTGEVAGTAPFVAPESLRGQELDQRTDLYSLGALGYFLITGAHAFPAKGLGSLEPMWQKAHRPPSYRASELRRDDLPEVPPAIDVLIEALLSSDPLARPSSAAEVIDRLQVAAGLEPDPRAPPIESYLAQPAFVGRTAERQQLRSALSEAAAGRGACALVESVSGLGRTRLLAELAIEARLASAAVLEVDAGLHRGTHGVAEAFALRMLDALPEAALEAAAPYATTLGHLSSAIRQRLGMKPAALSIMPLAHGEARMRVQVALRDWFLDVARAHTLVIVADDLDLFDEASAAWLVAIAREASKCSLFVLTSIRSDANKHTLAVQALRQSSIVIPLQALTLQELHELFRSIFGEAHHLARLVDLVHQHAEGNPGHAVDIAEHLVHEGAISYAEGAWLLPQTVGPALLPANRTGAELARLVRLPTRARALGQVLSVREGWLGLEMVCALAEIEGPPLFESLEALVREGVLSGSLDGYRFARESLREALAKELDPTRSSGAHCRLGRYLLAEEEISQHERLKAGVHLLLGGDETGFDVVAQAGKHFGLVELADLGPATPSFETALARMRAAGRPLVETVCVLGPLALAGYYAERRLASLYGEEAVDALQTVVGLKLARRLRTFMGRKLGLLVALAIAAIGFKLRARNQRAATFREAMMLLFNCVAALTGVCAISIDPDAASRYASVLEPMTALGPDHVATFMHEFCLNLVATTRDGQGEARARWTKMLARLDRPDAVRGLPKSVFALYLAGALYARGVLESWRDSSEALECARRLDELKLKLYEMSADQVRMMYYANRGNLELFEKYRERVEVHAIQRGTAWQVETWTFSGLITVYLRMHDPARLKFCVEQLKRLGAEVPSLRLAERRARAAYFVLRGTPAEALPLFEEAEEPVAVTGWARGEGVHARAHNDLGDHERAREICSHALARLSAEDLRFPALNLGVSIELARAEAALGNVSLAEDQLRALLAAHEDGANPLTMGALHEACAEVASRRGDQTARLHHVLEVERWYRPTKGPSLIARCQRLARDASLDQSGSGSLAPGPNAESSHVRTVVRDERGR